VKRLFLNIFAGLLALLVVPAVQAVPEQLTDAGNIADFADVRVDINGGRHLVWYDANVDSGAVFYRMFDQGGNLLIDTTQINDGGSGSSNTRPSLAVDGTSRLLVVWQNEADQEIYFLRLEPYLDDLDGSPADLATIRTVGDTRISDDQDGLAAVHPRAAVDVNGDLHIVWEDDCGPNVQYVKVDGDGIILNGPVLLGGAGSCNDRPDVAIDSAANVHVVFSNTGNTTSEEVYYAMLDGASAAVLIDSTLLTVDDGLPATRATLGVDTNDDKAYVVFTASTSTGEGIFMAALDSSLDDRDGSVADPAVIRLSETLVSSGSPQFAWHAFSRFGFDRRMHVTYMDFDASSCQAAGAGGPHNIIHAHVTTAGKVLARETLTAAGAASAACDPEARLSPGGNRIAWAESIVTAQEIFSDTFARADAGESGFTCSLGPAGSAWRAGDFWLLLVGLVALGVWCRRVPG
jgi:hypothetical protein